MILKIMQLTGCTLQGNRYIEKSHPITGTVQYLEARVINNWVEESEEKLEIV